MLSPPVITSGSYDLDQPFYRYTQVRPLRVQRQQEVLHGSRCLVKVRVVVVVVVLNDVQLSVGILLRSVYGVLHGHRLVLIAMHEQHRTLVAHDGLVHVQRLRHANGAVRRQPLEACRETGAGRWATQGMRSL